MSFSTSAYAGASDTLILKDNAAETYALKKARLAPAFIKNDDLEASTTEEDDDISEDTDDFDDEQEDDSEDESEVDNAFREGYVKGFDHGFEKGFEMGLKKAADKELFRYPAHFKHFLNEHITDKIHGKKRPPEIKNSKNDSSEPCFYEEANTGMAKRLVGKTHVLTVFVAEDKWDSEDKKKYIPNLDLAEEWLMKQAKRYKMEGVGFKNSFAGLEEDIIIDEIHNGTGSSKEHFQAGVKVFNALGYKNLHEYEEKAKLENPDCQNFLVIILANKNGSGYSQPCYYGADKGKFLDWAILYTKYIDGKYDDFTPQNIAHEILHIFGAWDLYLSSDHDKEQAVFAKIKFPNDIMRETYRDFEQLEIGPLTAWRVGFSDVKEDWYDYFEPDFYKERR